MTKYKIVNNLYELKESYQAFLRVFETIYIYTFYHLVFKLI